MDSARVLACVRWALNSFFLHSGGGERRTRISAPYGIFPAARRLESKFAVLQEEVERLLEGRQMMRYSEIDPVRASHISKEWLLQPLYILGVANESARDKCPSLIGFAEQTPEVVAVAVSMLEPGVSLAPHAGANAGLLRYHLCVKTPETNPPRLRVDQDFYTWKEGEGVVLDDTFEHEVENSSDGTRVVVIIDFRRPMGMVASLLNRYFLRSQRDGATRRLRAVNDEYLRDARRGGVMSAG
ncbi:aspartyl/asparaginyl beta-hydroxylase domain-containing protein [Streptomyces sp. NPDC093097]|uniref:aspartyl/asparaginyl beta-hydroxylase domain-containing protein n=1 Tax=Streptomyces sp. NPDC093097 TaxID=3366027 RepID=UPI0037FD5B62